MEFNAPGELGWQALKYAARKLPETDCAAFEEQLAEDQTAREAVAQAVELSHTVAVLHAAGGSCERITTDAILSTVPEGQAVTIEQKSTPHLTSRLRNWSRAAGWMGLGVAACLAVVLGTAHWFAVNSAADQAITNELVSSNWADLHNSREPSETSMLSEVAVEDGAGHDEDLGPDSPDEGGMVPEWLLLGVEKDSP